MFCCWCVVVAIPRKMVARVEAAGFVCSNPNVEPVPREQRGYAQGSRKGNAPPSPSSSVSKSQDGSAAPPESKQWSIYVYMCVCELNIFNYMHAFIISGRYPWHACTQFVMLLYVPMIM